LELGAKPRRARCLIQSARPDPAASAALTECLQFGPRNWRYSAQGSPALDPETVYDDGKETTLRFADNREVPAVYLVGSDGTESLVPKDVRGELVVVHAVGRELRLRRGLEVLCIFNEAYDGVGVNYRTNTTSPGVVRTSRRSPRVERRP